MDAPSQALLGRLEYALQRRVWADVRSLLSEVVSSSPYSGDNLQRLASSIELARSTVDVLIQTIEFNISSEAVRSTRESLAEAGVVQFATALLRTFTFEPRIVSRVATLLSHLAAANTGRTLIGGEGAVDALTTTWRSHLECVALVSALVALTPAHVDNVSRAMRRCVISTSVYVLHKVPFNRSAHHLFEVTIRLLAMCAICVPDRPKHRAVLVPTLIKMIRKATTQRVVTVVIQAFTALANIADCHVKEGDGYEIAEPGRVINVILKAWKVFPKNESLAASASWALASLVSTNDTALLRLKAHAKLLKILATPWEESSTTRFLCSLVFPLQAREARFARYNRRTGGACRKNMDLIRSEITISSDDDSKHRSTTPESPEDASTNVGRNGFVEKQSQPFDGLSAIDDESNVDLEDGNIADMASDTHESDATGQGKQPISGRSMCLGVASSPTVTDKQGDTPQTRRSKRISSQTSRNDIVQPEGKNDNSFDSRQERPNIDSAQVLNTKVPRHSPRLLEKEMRQTCNVGHEKELIYNSPIQSSRHNRDESYTEDLSDADESNTNDVKQEALESVGEDEITRDSIDSDIDQSATSGDAYSKQNLSAFRQTRARGGGRNAVSGRSCARSSQLEGRASDFDVIERLASFDGIVGNDDKDMVGGNNFHDSGASVNETGSMHILCGDTEKVHACADNAVEDDMHESGIGMLKHRPGTKLSTLSVVFDDEDTRTGLEEGIESSKDDGDVPLSSLRQRLKMGQGSSTSKPSGQSNNLPMLLQRMREVFEFENNLLIRTPRAMETASSLQGYNPDDLNMGNTASATSKPKTGTPRSRKRKAECISATRLQQQQQGKHQASERTPRSRTNYQCQANNMTEIIDLS